jgi:hypothetical protein
MPRHKIVKNDSVDLPGCGRLFVLPGGTLPVLVLLGMQFAAAMLHGVIDFLREALRLGVDLFFRLGCFGRFHSSG